MPRLSHDILNRLIEHHQYPCISIYMPVSPAFPGELENEPRYQDLLKRAEQELKVGYPTREIRELMDKCRSAVDEREFWNHRLAGLAVFCSPDLILGVDLPRSIPETVIVADSFQTKPLVRLLQMMDRYQVLCLTRKDVRLLEGDRDALDEVPLVNVPATIYEAFAEEARPVAPENTLNPPNTVPQPGMPPTGALLEERWFRIVDQTVLENHSRTSRLPLILCALPANQDAFRKISRNEYLVETGIGLDPDHVPRERIRDEAWKVMEPRYEAKIRQALDNFRAARAHHRGDDDLFQVAVKAALGRVSVLLVEADRHIGGKIDPQTGQVLMGDISDPMLGDLLDETAEAVLRTGGEVLVMPHEMMPTRTGAAAVYRY